jgi:ketosteroid isomerase-like protein
MSLDLPAAIARYIAAENRGDPDAVAQSFAEHAVVRDERRTLTGSAAIRQWKAETTKKYGHTIEPLHVRREDGRVIVTNRLAGSFPGSPVELRFLFRLEGARIASLEIRP